MQFRLKGRLLQLQGHKKGRSFDPLDVVAVIKGWPCFEGDTAGSKLARRASQPCDDTVSGWELHTAVEVIDIMLTPSLASSEENDGAKTAADAEATAGGQLSTMQLLSLASMTVSCGCGKLMCSQNQHSSRCSCLAIRCECSIDGQRHLVRLYAFCDA